jgi:predicted transposase/invertase (TIGR01784 family)
LYDEKAKVRYQDSMEIHFLEIPKLREDDGSQLYNWMKFFAATTKEEFMSVAQTNPAIAEAWGTIIELSGDERIRAIAESREKALMDMRSIRREGLQEGREEGLQEGLQKGRQEGRQGERVDIAKNLLRKNLSIEDVAEITGLTDEEVG